MPLPFVKRPKPQLIRLLWDVDQPIDFGVPDSPCPDEPYLLEAELSIDELILLKTLVCLPLQCYQDVFSSDEIKTLYIKLFKIDES